MSKITILKNPRVRIAPSPTGFCISGRREPRYLIIYSAKKYGGKFILRAEDTDKERSGRFEEDIMEGLKWLGMIWDEGPDIGGQFAPYHQSERSERHRFFLEKAFK